MSAERPPCMVAPPEAGQRRFVPFFAASLALAVVPGATLGTLGLMKLTWPWGGLDRAWIWTHGYVQAFGFLGLFVMGFAYHAVPRFVGAPLQHARLVPVSLACQLAGLLSVAVAFLAPLPDPGRRALWMLGAGALLVAARCFAAVVTATMSSRAAPFQPFEPWMAAGLFWLIAASAAACGAAIADDLAWHHLLWPAALYGFAGSWVFGAGRRLFGSSLGWKMRWPALEAPVFWVYQAGVLAWCVGAWPEDGVFRIARAFGAAALIAGVAGYAARVGWLRRDSTLDLDTADYRLYERWIHAGWSWLIAALATGPAWSLSRVLSGELDSITMLDFSRHALGLGFATHMVMGIGGRFIPVFCGTALWSPGAHRAALWLLTLSLAIRSLEVPLAAGYWSATWPLLGLSGPPALIAFALFAANIYAAMLGRGRLLSVFASRRGRPGRAPIELRVIRT